MRPHPDPLAAAGGRGEMRSTPGQRCIISSAARARRSHSLDSRLASPVSHVPPLPRRASRSFLKAMSQPQPPPPPPPDSLPALPVPPPPTEHPASQACGAQRLPAEAVRARCSADHRDLLPLAHARLPPGPRRILLHAVRVSLGLRRAWAAFRRLQRLIHLRRVQEGRDGGAVPLPQVQQVRRVPGLRWYVPALAEDGINRSRDDHALFKVGSTTN